MSSHMQNLGAPDSTVINGEFRLLQVAVVQQSVKTSGSDMLLCVDARFNGSNHQFLVGGYWSTSGFRLTSMLQMDRIASSEGNGCHNATALLYGVTFSNPSSVLKDRVQQSINNQDVGRPENPSEAFSQRKAVEDWLPDGAGTIDGPAPRT